MSFVARVCTCTHAVSSFLSCLASFLSSDPHLVFLGLFCGLCGAFCVFPFLFLMCLFRFFLWWWHLVYGYRIVDSYGYRLVWLSILVRFVWFDSMLWFLSGSCFGFCLPIFDWFSLFFFSFFSSSSFFLSVLSSSVSLSLSQSLAQPHSLQCLLVTVQTKKLGVPLSHGPYTFVDLSLSYRSFR